VAVGILRDHFEGQRVGEVGATAARSEEPEAGDQDVAPHDGEGGSHNLKSLKPLQWTLQECCKLDMAEEALALLTVSYEGCNAPPPLSVSTTDMGVLGCLCR
jgi:hypothetical protein